MPGLDPASLASWAGSGPAASATAPALLPSLGRPKAGAFGLVPGLQPGLADTMPACLGFVFPFQKLKQVQLIDNYLNFDRKIAN